MSVENGIITKKRLFKYISKILQKKKKKKKKENFQIKNSDIFHISAQNIDCGTRLNRLGEVVLMSTNNLCF